MPDLNAINLCLQNRMEREMRKEVTAVEAATWLDEAGLLRNDANGLPLQGLLHAGRILGHEQRPKKPNGRWWIRRLASSSEPHEPERMRALIWNILPINRKILPAGWPLPSGDPAFWEDLGRTVAVFGYLENELATECYQLSAMSEDARRAAAAGDERFRKWYARLQRSWTDSLHALTNAFRDVLEKNDSVPRHVVKDLIDRLEDLRPWRNALCHGAWLSFSGDGSGVLHHYYRSEHANPKLFPQNPSRFRPQVTQQDLADVRARTVEATIRVAEAASMAGAGSALTALPREPELRQPGAA